VQYNPFANRVIKTKKLGLGLFLKVSENDHSERIFVDFYTEDGRLKIQKSFKNDRYGKQDSKEFQKKFKTSDDLRKYFGMVKA